jgi:hypothetical protein
MESPDHTTRTISTSPLSDGLSGTVPCPTFDFASIDSPYPTVLQRLIRSMHDTGQTLARIHLRCLQEDGVINIKLSPKDKLSGRNADQEFYRRRMELWNGFDGKLVENFVPKKNLETDNRTFKTYCESFWKSYLGIREICVSFFLMLKLIFLYDAPKFCQILCIDGRNLTDSELKAVKLALWDHFYSLSPGCPEAEDLRKEIT